MAYVYRINEKMIIELENLDAVSTTDDGNGIRVNWRHKEPQVFHPISLEERRRFYDYLMHR